MHSINISINASLIFLQICVVSNCDSEMFNVMSALEGGGGGEGSMAIKPVCLLLWKTV